MGVNVAAQISGEVQTVWGGCTSSIFFPVHFSSKVVFQISQQMGEKTHDSLLEKFQTVKSILVPCFLSSLIPSSASYYTT